MATQTQPVLFTIEPPLQLSPELVTAVKLAILYHVPLRIVYIAEKVFHPGVPVREGGAIVAVKPSAMTSSTAAREKLDFICGDLMIKYPLLDDCTAIIREGFAEREFLEVVQEEKPLWTVWSNSKEGSALDKVIYNLAVGNSQDITYPLLILNDRINLFPPEVVHFYFSEGKMDNDKVSEMNGIASQLHASLKIYEVMENVTVSSLSQAGKKELMLKNLTGNSNLSFSRIDYHRFHFQVKVFHSGIKDIMVLDHEDRQIITKEFDARNTRVILEETQNPVLIA